MTVKNNNKVKKEDTIQRLSELDAEEVSIVTRGANKKTFSIVKSQHGIAFSKAMEGDQESLQEVMKLLIEKCSDETKVNIGISKEDPGTAVPTVPSTEAGVTSVSKEDFDALAATVTELQTQIAKTETHGDEIKKLQDDPRFEVMNTRINKISNNTNPQTTIPAPAPVTKAETVEEMTTLGMKPLNE